MNTPQFVTDFSNLLNAIMLILVGITGVIAVVLVIKEVIAYMQADGNEKQIHKENVKKIILGGIFVIICESALSWVFSFFIH